MSESDFNIPAWLSRLEPLLDNDSDRALLAQFVSLLDRLQDIKKKQHDRFLPVGEYLSDRWQRAQKMGFGDGTSIYDSAIVLGNVSVGINTWLGPNTLLDGSGGLTIGSNCSISAGVQIYSHDSVAWATSGGKKEYEYCVTKIGDNCYIGPNTIISKGVIVGDGAVVGANSFVNSDVAVGARVAGNPARILSIN